MFYLLENNRIIDSNVSYTKVLPFWEEKEGRLFAKGKSGKSYQVFKYDKIKKQSENVFDLIEMGDLLYMPFDCNGTVVHRFDMFKCYKYNAFHCSIHIVHEKGIFAIYKPDEKGNYINVWEREEE
jgi:hypothetical protein